MWVLLVTSCSHALPAAEPSLTDGESSLQADVERQCTGGYASGASRMPVLAIRMPISPQPGPADSHAEKPHHLVCVTVHGCEAHQCGLPAWGTKHAIVTTPPWRLNDASKSVQPVHSQQARYPRLASVRPVAQRGHMHGIAGHAGPGNDRHFHARNCLSRAVVSLSVCCSCSNGLLAWAVAI